MAREIVFDKFVELPYALEEAVNRLRVNVGFLGSDIKKIMIISSEPNEGKSFITMHLWKQMAMAGESIVMVDADMRNSVIQRDYGMKAKDGSEIKGTSHYLSGDFKLEDVIYKTKWEKAAILPNTNNVVNPSLLLESEKFDGMLKEMSEKFRYVLVDAPPLELVSDGESIASKCDGAILCVRGGVTSKKVIRNSINRLERAGCPLLGVVLNRVNESKGKYYGGKYGKKYYYSEYYGGK